MESVSNSLHRHGRRLCELLEEQQEPFLLDAYLSQHGYSDRRAADAAACVCCLGSACSRLKGLSDYWLVRRKRKKKKKSEAVRHVLAKIACDRMIRRAWRRNAAAIDRLMKAENHGGEFHRLSSAAATDEAEMDKEERSPVSVLALHSPVAAEGEESTSPSSFGSTEEAENSGSNLEDRLRELEESLRVDYCDGIVNLSQLISGDLSSSNKEWSQFEHERREVGAEIEHIIFEEIRQETALDLLLHCNCTLLRRPSVVDDSSYYYY
ncbi:uncharacterized protein LOC121968153 [Zingiber officinale]|uniref:uncharacterized protein LOC121968153 n=1 Tax=Zingiber officinale TaxID=94328 RepID=UPI001C4B0103|nr:uncharacterized protein LOC121968153 [Zingiber officinale]